MDKQIPVDHYKMAGMHTVLSKNIHQYLYAEIALAFLDKQISYAVLLFLLSIGAHNMVAYDLNVDLNCIVCTMKQMLQGSFCPIYFLLVELSGNQVIQFEKYLHYIII